MSSATEGARTMKTSKLARSLIITTKRSTRTQKICKFTPHYMCAAWSGETCATYFKNTDRQCSANYCIGTDGGIVCNVPEEYRAWTTSSSWNDQRAITVECGNLEGGRLTQATWDSLVKLGADVCRRYGFRPTWTGDKTGSLTAHYMFASTDCPGPWLKPRMRELALAIQHELDGVNETPKQEKPKVYEILGRDPGGKVAMRTIQGSVSRLYNKENGDHLYTTDPNEAKALVKAGWLNEGTLGIAPAGLCVLYRLYNESTGEHLLTADYREATKLAESGKSYSNGKKTGWHSEGEPFIAYVGDRGGTDVHRLHEPNGRHILTTSENEVNALIKAGWEDEGIAFSLDRA